MVVPAYTLSYSGSGDRRTMTQGLPGKRRKALSTNHTKKQKDLRYGSSGSPLA
jgi:hypothetical protein